MRIGKPSLMVRVDNFDTVECEVGRLLARRYEVELAKRVKRVCGAEASVNPIGGGRLTVEWAVCSRARFFQYEPEHRRMFAQELKCDLGATVKLNSVSIAPRLSVSWQAPFQFSQGVEEAWPHAYVSDLRRAFEVYDAVSKGRLQLWRQPIVDATLSGRVLYEECLARMSDGVGRVSLLPGEFIPGLERLGLMRCLDLRVMRLAMSMLASHPGLELGVNVSGQSAVDDVWWGHSLRELEDRPDVAQRLVIEITETARLLPGLGRQFCNRFKYVGCRISIDDFGAGFGVETSIEVGNPDVIKIDGLVLRAAVDEASLKRLEAMVRMAGELAPVVVVEGVESERDLQLVRQAGGGWVQGRFVGQPKRPD